MQGFDPEFESLPDYILKITAKIWEERGIGPALQAYYADDVVVRSSTGVLTSNQAVAQATVATLYEFPDRKLLGEDVIWTEAPNDGYFSSHRLICTVTHAGDGVYGAATHKRATYRIIADCAVRDNKIYDEWLSRDQGAIAVCLGASAKELAIQQLDAGLDQVWQLDQDVKGQYQAQISTDLQAQMVADTWLRVFNQADLQAVQLAYAEGVNQFQPSGKVGYGHKDVDCFFVGLKSAFPDAQLEIEHLICRDDPGYPKRVALRWLLKGTHSGYGGYGPPTGRSVAIRGFCHAQVSAARIQHEWVCFDEVALWKQILGAGL